MRVLFMGTPDIAASCLSALAASHHKLCGVVTSPDKPRGRKYVMTPPPVATTHGPLSQARRSAAVSHRRKPAS